MMRGIMIIIIIVVVIIIVMNGQYTLTSFALRQYNVIIIIVGWRQYLRNVVGEW
jgi:hypothetical protein